MGDDRRIRFCTISLVLFCLSALLLPTRAQADIVYLKVGGKIKNCRVVNKTEDSVTLRTPGGPMQVPRSAIKRIQKTPSIFDTYDQKRARVADDSAGGLYGLAKWCRGNGGLRSEGDTLLRKVIKVDPGHVDARHRLGYVWDGKKWVQLPPLSVALDLPEKGNMKSAVSRYFSQAVRARKDVRVVSSLEKVKDIHACTVKAKVTMGRTRGPEFYGMELSGPSVHAIISLAASGKLLGNGRHTVSVKGEVRAKVKNANENAVNDAFARGTQRVNQFFDRITLQRVHRIEAAHKAARGGAAPVGK